MKTQVGHSTPTTLGPFLRLIRKLATQLEADAVDKLQNPAREAPDLRATAAGEQRPGAETARHVLTRAFLTLLLRSQSHGAVHSDSSLTDREWWQGSAAPRGAVLVARYASR
jgi:hypothetical protein